MLGRYKVWQKVVIYIVLVIMAFATLFPLLYGIACSLRSDTEIFK